MPLDNEKDVDAILAQIKKRAIESAQAELNEDKKQEDVYPKIEKEEPAQKPEEPVEKPVQQEEPVKVVEDKAVEPEIEDDSDGFVSVPQQDVKDREEQLFGNNTKQMPKESDIADKGARGTAGFEKINLVEEDDLRAPNRSFIKTEFSIDDERKEKQDVKFDFSLDEETTEDSYSDDNDLAKMQKITDFEMDVDGQNPEEYFKEEKETVFDFEGDDGVRSGDIAIEKSNFNMGSIDTKDNQAEYDKASDFKRRKPVSGGVVTLISLIMVLIVAGAAYYIITEPNAEPTETITVTHKTNGSVNPLTGEDSYNDDAVSRRPVAFVIETGGDALPQWGTGSPDIVFETEIDEGLTRMVWLYADYESVPYEVGPISDARPMDARFCKMFDAIMIHKETKQQDEQISGAKTYMTANNIDNVNFDEDLDVFSHDRTERKFEDYMNAVADGTKLEDLIINNDFRTTINKKNYPTFEFYDKDTEVGTGIAGEVNLAFSKVTKSKAVDGQSERQFDYDLKDKTYHTVDWKDETSFKNIIILFSKNKYETVSYADGDGVKTYTTYNFNSGSGYYISNDSYVKVKWRADDTLEILNDSTGKPIKLNKGKTYIALASSNNIGTITFTSKRSTTKPLD